MELSPLEIKSQKFPKKIKGYDVTEVDNFLEIVSKDLEILYGQYYSLKEELVKKNQEITDYKEKDKSISEAILMVQSVSNDIKKTAITEAEFIKKGAITEAENIINNANKKYLEITTNIDDLLNKRIVIINSIKNLLLTNIDLINREAGKNIEVSFPSEHVKIDIQGGISNNNTFAADNTAVHENINAPDADADTPEQDNNPSSGVNTENKEKDLAELLGDINKFTF